MVARFAALLSHVLRGRTSALVVEEFVCVDHALKAIEFAFAVFMQRVVSFICTK